MVVGEFSSSSSKFLLAKKEGRGKYQPIKQRGSKTTNGGVGGQNVF
jgi:hypothetical protein